MHHNSRFAMLLRKMDANFGVSDGWTFTPTRVTMNSRIFLTVVSTEACIRRASGWTLCRAVFVATAVAGSADGGSAVLLFLILEMLIFFAVSLKWFTGFVFCAKTMFRAVARHGKCWDGV